MSIKIYKSKGFDRFARKEGITDEMLVATVKDVEKGLIDADYRGGVIKQRIARANEGKSGGYRSIIMYIKGKKAFFEYGFSKSDRDNIARDEVQEFKALAKIVLGFSDADLAKAVKAGVYKEVRDD